MVLIYTGMPPAEVLEAAQLPPLAPVNRSGFAVGPQLTKSRSLVRQSVPGYGGRTRLGGASSFQSMGGFDGLKDVPRVETLEAERKQEEMTAKIFLAAVDSKCDDIDRQCGEKLKLPRPQLADYALEIAEKARQEMEAARELRAAKAEAERMLL